MFVRQSAGLAALPHDLLIPQEEEFAVFAQHLRSGRKRLKPGKWQAARPRACECLFEMISKSEPYAVMLGKDDRLDDR